MVLQHLEHHMNKLNKSVDDLAKKVALTPRSIRQLLKKRGTTRNTAIRIAKALGTTVDELI